MPRERNFNQFNTFPKHTEKPTVNDSEESSKCTHCERTHGIFRSINAGDQSYYVELTNLLANEHTLKDSLGPEKFKIFIDVYEDAIDEILEDIAKPHLRMTAEIYKQFLLNSFSRLEYKIRNHPTIISAFKSRDPKLSEALLHTKREYELLLKVVL
jgi:hypothetical protein